MAALCVNLLHLRARARGYSVADGAREEAARRLVAWIEAEVAPSLAPGAGVYVAPCVTVMGGGGVEGQPNDARPHRVMSRGGSLNVTREERIAAARVFNGALREAALERGYSFLRFPLAQLPHSLGEGEGCDGRVPPYLVRWDGIHLRRELTWHWWHASLTRARCERGDTRACGRSLPVLDEGLGRILEH